jgi:hypothetical protein
LAVVATPREVVKPEQASGLAAAVAKGTQVAGRAVGAANKAGAAAATYHFVGDLNGDGRADMEDLRLAKAAVSKLAGELGGEAVELGKATMRHQLVKDAAAGAVVGGAVAAVVPRCVATVPAEPP